MSEPVTCFRVGRREGGKRLDHFMQERIPGLSRARIQRAIRERVELSWTSAARPSTPVRPGGEVRIGYTPVPETLIELHIPVLARGPGWLAVDKPPGLPVHPVNDIRENTVIRMLRRQEGDPGLRLAHRLDRETSGVLLVAADSATARVFSQAFRQGRVQKEYAALVAGSVAGEQGTIDLPIGEASDSPVFVRRAVVPDGQRAVTEWKVEARLSGRTLLRLFPRTGRRHQLRVHLAATGHPILGDILYGRPDQDYLDMVRGVRDARREQGSPRRQLLHCARIELLDAAGQAAAVAASPLPADFSSWLQGG